MLLSASAESWMQMKQDVFNLKAEKDGDVVLNPEIFGLGTRVDILSRVIEWQLAKRRSGNHKTKQVSEVQGSTRKIYRQKGTGGARHGSNRRTQFRGGSVTFGPVVRSHAYALPKKIRKLGLKLALSEKVRNGQLKIVRDLSIDTGKTKEFSVIRDAFLLKNTLIIDASLDVCQNMLRAVSNHHEVDILPQIGANVYDIMRKDMVIITLEAVKVLEERLA